MRSVRSRHAGLVALLAAMLVALGLPSFAAATPPSFVQQVTARANATSKAVTLPNAVTTGDRIVVEVGIWSSAHATAGTVKDAAGNTYTRLVHFAASDGTELSVWSAPVTLGGGTKPAITVTPTAKADLGIAVVEYSGLSTVADATVLDQSAQATGTSSGTGVVSSGPTPATTAGNELALGFYVDSGFGKTLTAANAFTQRSNVSPTSDMEFVVEDKVVGQGEQPNAGVGTGSGVPWLMATVVLRPAAGGQPTAPGAPVNVTAQAGNGTATVSWTAPFNGGSGLTSYTITPYIGTTPQTPTVLSGAPPATSAQVSGLTNGTGYTFTVTATNAIGTGPASAPSNPVTPTSTPQGQWSATMTWPFVAVHAVALTNGKYLLWDGWHQPEPTYLWDPVANTFTSITAPDSIFCSGNALLPDGKVLTVGGYGVVSTGELGIKDTAIFDPATSTWKRGADMHYPRWYPSLTQLADGRYLTISGNSADAYTWAEHPEVYDPGNDTWTVLNGISTTQVHEDEYPFAMLAPNGKVFTIGPSEDVSYWLDADNQTWTPVGPSGVVNGSATMYRPGKVLYSGGSATISSGTPSQASTSVIDLTGATPAWRHTSPMNTARDFHTLTTLPDGQVLAVGGAPTSDQTLVNNGVLPAEIWNPDTEKWTTVASMSVPRQYHQTALLMPDGRVLVAGGGHTVSASGPGQFSAQIYSPPYLFNGTRPVISSAPASAAYGSTMTVSTPDAASVTAVNLVSMGADTHQSDMDQHFVPLSFTRNGTTLSVQAPPGGTIAPAGTYMLFLVNGNGVPSVAAQVRILPSLTAPSAPSNVTAVAGNASATVSWSAPGDGGSPITSYTVTPYIGSVAQSPVTVAGATNTQVTGLTNGTPYTFTVTATNAVGTSPPSAASTVVTPSPTPAPGFVQQASGRGLGATRAVTMPSTVLAGDRMVVEVGVWNTENATATGVTDSAGNTYTRLSTKVAPDGTELSVWSAPITAGGGTKPTITARVSSSADVGVAAVEYSGLSPVAGTGVVDQSVSATGTTAVASSGQTAATTAGGELAVGFYADSGFSRTLTAGAGFSQRVNVSPAGDMEFLVEDQPVTLGSRPNATIGTAASTPWIVTTIVFKHG
ncbi:fibronectin type III domain-containing protein [Labedaea rhizosphaerae]|uniref:Fibronectin type III domain protein n=1 Tax=Labedaea rhizosphaerae TaxID=598644 RepID=A0A4R6SFZ5_LABRH|nr:fibronectin type III domain-containing protein [Labedaea rhizosphaerae]TDQ00276.1 fibronectin type III domain protein [Labedaea rhizosphaerae]